MHTQRFQYSDRRQNLGKTSQVGVADQMDTGTIQIPPFKCIQDAASIGKKRGKDPARPFDNQRVTCSQSPHRFPQNGRIDRHPAPKGRCHRIQCLGKCQQPFRPEVLHTGKDPAS